MNISTTTLAISIPDEILARVKQMAAKQNRPLDNCIASLLESGLNNMAPPKRDFAEVPKGLF